MMRPLGFRYRALLALSRLALLSEAAWPRLWPIFAVIGAFIFVSLLDVLPALPGWLHGLVLVVFAAALGLVAWRSWRGLRPVTHAAARHRLERDSGLDHRPLTALEDTLTGGGGDEGARLLWQLHLERAREAVGRLRLGRPTPDVARADPFGLRILVVLVLVIAVAVGEDATARIGRALAPDFSSEPPRPIAAELWITPPAYTRAAPVFLEATTAAPSEGVMTVTAEAEPRAASETLQVPEGSAVLAQVEGAQEAPRLELGVGSSVPFEALGADAPTPSFRVETTVDMATRLAVLAGTGVVAEWPVEIVPDTAPRIDLVDTPEADASSYLTFRYAASDDYGVVDVTAVVRRTDGSPDLEGAAVLRLPLTLPHRGEGSVTGGGAHDLTEHVWAGHEVTVHLEAEDAVGQVGRSDPAILQLPERTFTHPVAIAVIGQRKRLLADEAAVRAEVARALAGIGAEPERFANDVVVSLGLAVAGARLTHERSAAAIPSVRALLWDTALRIEMGTVPVAEQRLREAQERLAEALRSDRDAAEIDRLMTELQQALREYMEAVAAELARRGESLPEMPENAQAVRAQDLMDLVETARRLAKSGARESAEQLLSQLQSMLDAMRRGLENSEGAQKLLEANQLMNDLQGLAGRQQDLLDETFQRLQELRAQAQRQGARRGQPRQGEGTPGGNGEGAEGRPGAADQEALRRALGDLMLRFDEVLGGIPAPLGFADRAMKGAGRALGSGRPGDAVPLQTEAVRQLQQASDQAAQMMSQQFGGMAGVTAGQSPQPFGEGVDPFGRTGEGGERGLGVDAVDIPDRMKIRRVEEILQELRRRAGQYDRPQLELDYIERLLRRF